MIKLENLTPEIQKREQEFKKEQEPKPEKIILIIRHPSVKWSNFVFNKAEQRGEDIETYAPIDKSGLKMTRLLLEYLQGEYLQKHLPETIGKNGIDKEYTIWTSPIKRAKNEAKIVSKNIKLAHTENPKIPIPKNNEPIEDKGFSEIPWMKNKQEALDLLQEAKEKNINPDKLWFDKYSNEILERINKMLPDIENGIDALEKSNTPIDIVFTHRVTCALMIWVIEQKNKDKKNLIMTKDKLKRIIELAGQITHTSITEIRKTKDKYKENWKVHSLGSIPHLDQEPELKENTF